MEGQVAEVSTPEPAAPGPVGYADRAARGLASTIVSSLMIKAVLFAGQIVIGWYLTKSQLGVAATAIAASIFPGLIKEIGIQAMLQRYPRRYAVWSADAAWMANVLALAAGLLTLASAPLVAYLADSQTAKGLMAVLALSTLLSGPSLVPFTKLAIDLRFVLMARMNTAFTVISTIASIILAIGGAGPYAVVLPVLLGSISRMIVGAWLVPMKWESRPAWTRCRVMLADGWKMMLSLFFFQIIWQCDYLILGVFHSQEQVGIYYLAFSLSTQALTLLSQNLGGVLLPVLGHMSGESARQTEGYVRAIRYLCVLGIPLCFAQAAVAEPLLKLIWRDKWIDAIPALQALSIGSAFRLLSFPSASLLMAQGRMTTYLVNAAISSMAFLLVVTFAAQVGQATSVAIAVAMFYVITEACIAAVAMSGPKQGGRSFIGGLQVILGVLVAPVVAGIVGGVVGYFTAGYILPRLGPFAATLAGGSLAVITSGAAILVLAPDVVRGLLTLSRSVVSGTSNSGEKA